MSLKHEIHYMIDKVICLVGKYLYTIWPLVDPKNNINQLEFAWADEL